MRERIKIWAAVGFTNYYYDRDLRKFVWKLTLGKNLVFPTRFPWNALMIIILYILERYIGLNWFELVIGLLTT